VLLLLLLLLLLNIHEDASVITLAPTYTIEKVTDGFGWTTLGATATKVTSILVVTVRGAQPIVFCTCTSSMSTSCVVWCLLQQLMYERAQSCNYIWSSSWSVGRWCSPSTGDGVGEGAVPPPHKKWFWLSIWWVLVHYGLHFFTVQLPVSHWKPELNRYRRIKADNKALVTAFASNTKARLHQNMFVYRLIFE